MSGQLYQIVFTGQILEGAELSKVKQNIAKLFKASDKQLTAFFSGKRIVIKNKVDQATAKKYQIALTQAGAQSIIEPMGGVGVAENTSGTVNSSPDQTVETLEIAPVGATIGPQSQESIPPMPDVSHISLAAVGATIDNVKKEEPPPAPDVSYMTIGDVGDTLGVASKEPPPPAPDVSGISIAPVGSDLSEKSDKPVPDAPDTSHISLKPD